MEISPEILRAMVQPGSGKHAGAEAMKATREGLMANRAQRAEIQYKEDLIANAQKDQLIRQAKAAQDKEIAVNREAGLQGRHEDTLAASERAAAATREGEAREVAAQAAQDPRLRLPPEHPQHQMAVAKYQAMGLGMDLRQAPQAQAQPQGGAALPGSLGGGMAAPEVDTMDDALGVVDQIGMDPAADQELLQADVPPWETGEEVPEPIVVGETIIDVEDGKTVITAPGSKPGTIESMEIEPGPTEGMDSDIDPGDYSYVITHDGKELVRVELAPLEDEGMAEVLIELGAALERGDIQGYSKGLKEARAKFGDALELQIAQQNDAFKSITAANKQKRGGGGRARKLGKDDRKMFLSTWTRIDNDKNWKQARVNVEGYLKLKTAVKSAAAMLEPGAEINLVTLGALKAALVKAAEGEGARISNQDIPAYSGEAGRSWIDSAVASLTKMVQSYELTGEGGPHRKQLKDIHGQLSQARSAVRGRVKVALGTLGAPAREGAGGAEILGYGGRQAYRDRMKDTFSPLGYIWKQFLGSEGAAYGFKGAPSKPRSASSVEGFGAPQ